MFQSRVNDTEDEKDGVFRLMIFYISHFTFFLIIVQLMIGKNLGK